MRLMSFALTVDAMRAGTKTVTRRTGWHHAKPGDRLLAVEKARGVPVADRVELGVIEVVTVRRERLDTLLRQPDYGAEEVALEGFGYLLSVDAFVDMFCKANRCEAAAEVTRIEFRTVPE